MSRIATLRRSIGMTQADLADAIGSSQGAVSNYERGNDPSMDVGRKLVAFFRSRGVMTNLDQMFGDEASGDRSLAEVPITAPAELGES